MTQVIQKGKKIPPRNHYPKSSTKMVAKIEKRPKAFRSFYEKADYFALGDSFVNMFLHAQNAFFIKLKGKSLKGLAKCDKEERRLIENWVDQMPPSCEVIFNFGQVDLNFVRYYKLAHNQTYPDETFQEYVQWISSLSRKSIILGILASPIKSENIYDVLQKYNTLQGQSIECELIQKEHEKTESIRKRWNELIKVACLKYGVKFINVFDYDKQLEPKFVDQNPLTVHLRYLPTLIEVQKKLPRLLINIKKSLQIEQEYVTEKTSRYYRNLEIIQERKRLESIESQETKTENNSSRDDTEENEQELQSNKINSDDQFINLDQQSQNPSDKEPPESLLQEINFDSQNDDEYPEIKIDLLLEEMHYQKSIISYSSQTFIYHLAKFVNDPVLQQEQKVNEVLERFFNQLIQEAVGSIEINQTFIRSPWWGINKIKDFTEFIVNDEGKQKVTKVFVRCLQQIFQKNLYPQNKANINSKITVPKVTKFIVDVFHNQKYFQFPLLKDKLIIRIMQQIVVSLFENLLLNKVQRTRLQIYCQCISILKVQLSQFMDKTLKKKLEKNNLSEFQLQQKFKSVLQKPKPQHPEEIQKLKTTFYYLLNDKFSFAVCSQKFLTLMIQQIEKKILLDELNPIIESVQKKLKSVEVQKSCSIFDKVKKIDSDLNTKIQEIDKKEKENHGHWDPTQKCCRCGCLLGLTQLLKKPQKNKKKTEKMIQ